MNKVFIIIYQDEIGTQFHKVYTDSQKADSEAKRIADLRKIEKYTYYAFSVDEVDEEIEVEVPLYQGVQV